MLRINGRGAPSASRPYLTTANAIFRSLLFSDIPEVKVYMDNILLATGKGYLVSGVDLLNHAQIVCKMLDRMTEYSLWVRPEKWFFLRDCIRTLGHVVSIGMG